jgi:hypothetical protein
VDMLARFAREDGGKFWNYPSRFAAYDRQREESVGVGATGKMFDECMAYFKKMEE